MMRRWWLVGAAVALTLAGAPALAGSQAVAAVAPAQGALAGSNVLLVCNGSTTPCPGGVSVYSTVQSAVNAASPGDWILIWPGVYHEKSTEWPTAGVWIQTPDLHIRGLDRNSVIIDGSNGTASQPCPSDPSLQDTNGGAGRDGIVVYKVSGVTIQNLTVCDYLSGTGGHGNEIWWNGGDTTGMIGMGAYRGSYLTATSMYGPSDVHSPNLAQYGIFVSNASGPGVIEKSYASNMADASYYVGACQQQCNTTLIHDYGTNSDARLLGHQRRRQAGHHGLGVRPRPHRDRAELAEQRRRPAAAERRVPGHHHQSCMIIEHNVIKNNNNANAPTSGIAGAVGAGVEVSGGAYDTVRDNLIIHNGSWGVVTHDYPDTETPPQGSHCQGGVQVSPKTVRLSPAHGNRCTATSSRTTGTFGNVTNGDLATVGLLPNSATPRNCFYSNRDAAGRVTSEPKNIQTTTVDGRPCGKPGTSIDGALVDAADLRHRRDRPRHLPEGIALPEADQDLHRAAADRCRPCPTRVRACPANPFCSSKSS